MNWTMFWTLTIGLANTFCVYYLGYLKGRKDCIDSQLSMLKLCDYFRDREIERNQTHGKSDN